MSSDNWCSPPEIAEPLAELFGGPVDLDPCSNDKSIIQAHLRLQRGGLTLPWTGVVYQNDPYSQAGVWTAKMLSELASGNATELVRLSMMSTSTQWWEDMCMFRRRNPRILGLRRLAFIDARTEPELLVASVPLKRSVCRFEPALTYFGPRERQFTKAFAHLTRWAARGR